MGAIIGHDNAHIEKLKMAWEPARFVAFTFWNATVSKKFAMKHEQELRRFPWEKKEFFESDIKKVKKDVMKFRSVWRDKWGLKYENE